MYKNKNSSVVRTLDLSKKEQCGFVILLHVHAHFIVRQGTLPIAGVTDTLKMVQEKIKYTFIIGFYKILSSAKSSDLSLATPISKLGNVR